MKQETMHVEWYLDVSRTRRQYPAAPPLFVYNYTRKRVVFCGKIKKEDR